MEDAISIINNVGFPIFVAIFILIRIEPRLNKLTDAINKLIPIVEEDGANTKDVKDAINNLRLGIAKLNGKK